MIPVTDLIWPTWNNERWEEAGSCEVPWCCLSSSLSVSGSSLLYLCSWPPPFCPWSAWIWPWAEGQGQWGQTAWHRAHLALSVLECRVCCLGELSTQQNYQTLYNKRDTDIAIFHDFILYAESEWTE